MSLEAELLAVDGVAQAEVDLESDGPIGLRITIVPGADSAQVAQQVSEVLANRGLSSSVTPIAEASGYRRTIVAGEEQGAPKPDPAPRPDAAHIQPGTPDAKRSPRVQHQAIEVATAAVSESAKGVELALRMSDGRRVSRRTRANPEAVAQGVVTALADLIGGLVEPVSLVECQRRKVQDATIVTVVVTENGRMGVASAQEHGTSILSVAKAAWKAIQDLDD